MHKNRDLIPTLGALSVVRIYCIIWWHSLLVSKFGLVRIITLILALFSLYFTFWQAYYHENFKSQISYLRTMCIKECTFLSQGPPKSIWVSIECENCYNIFVFESQSVLDQNRLALKGLRVFIFWLFFFFPRFFRVLCYLHDNMELFFQVQIC